MCLACEVAVRTEEGLATGSSRPEGAWGPAAAPSRRLSVAARVVLRRKAAAPSAEGVAVVLGVAGACMSGQPPGTSSVAATEGAVAVAALHPSVPLAGAVALVDVGRPIKVAASAA